MKPDYPQRRFDICMQKAKEHKEDLDRHEFVYWKERAIYWCNKIKEEEMATSREIRMMTKMKAKSVNPVEMKSAPLTAADIINCTPKRQFPTHGIIEDLVNFAHKAVCVADCPPAQPGPQGQCYPVPETNKKEEEMYNPFEVDGDFGETVVAPTDQRQRDFLLSSLRQETYKINGRAEKTFYLYDDSRPRSPKALIDRIAAGQYILAKEKEERDSWDPLDYFQWRDPSKPADRKGYDEFVAGVEKDKDKAFKQIVIALPEKGLEILDTFTSKYAN